MRETLEMIMLVLGIINTSLIVLGGITATLCKPVRRWIISKSRGIETDRCLLRDRITSIYYNHYHECEMKLYDYENMERLYKQYKKIGGNSFVDKIWEEVQTWTIDQ